MLKTMPPTMKRITVDSANAKSPLRDHGHDHALAGALPEPKEVKVHPTHGGGEDASIYFVGTATTIM